MLKTLKQNLTLQIINKKDYYLKEQNKKVIGLIKDKLGGLRPKTFSYLIDDSDENKKSKRHKKIVIERQLGL